MTDSSIDKNPGEGGFDAGPSMEELFGDIEEESPEGEQIDRQKDDPGDDEEIEDLTAADVFNQLRDEVSASDETNTVLEEESPEDIIASADDPVVEADEIDDDLVDEGALDSLLLTGRTKGEEFLWVDSDDSTETTESESTDAMADPADGKEEDPEQVTDRPEQDEVVESHGETVESHDEDLETETTPLSTAETEASVTDSTASESAGRRDYSLESTADELDSSDTAAGDTPDDATDEIDASLEESTDDTAAAGTLEDEDETGGEMVLSDVEKTDAEMVPVEEDEESGGFFSWLRSKLPF